MAQQHIHCSVNNCHYWKTGNICDANEIMVTTDAIGDAKPDNFDAMQASNFQETPADTCMATCCKTFVKTGSDATNLDGIKRI